MYGEPLPPTALKGPSTYFALRGRMALVGAFLVHLTLGSLHAFGNILPFVVSYMRQLQQEPSLKYYDGLLFYVVAVVFHGLGGFTGFSLQQTLGPCKAVLFGASVMSVGFVMSALSLHSYVLFCLSFGVVAALGSGISFAVPLSNALRWFPHRKGVVSCVIFLGRGLSVCLLCPAQSLFLFGTTSTPLRNFVSDQEAALALQRGEEMYLTDGVLLQRLPLLFLAMAGGFLCVQAVGAWLLSEPESLPLDESEKRRLIDEIRVPSPSTASSLLSSFVLTPQDVCSSRNFWVLFGVTFLSWHSLLIAASLWKALPFLLFVSKQQPETPVAAVSAFLGSEWLGVGWHSASDGLLSMAAALAGAACIVGRILWAFAGDKAGHQRILIVANLLMGPLFLTMMSTGVESPRHFALWLCLINSLHGGLFSLLPSATSDLFGCKNFGTVHLLLFAAKVAAAASAVFMTRVVLQVWGSYTLCAALAGCHIFCALLCLLFHPTEALPNPYKLVLA